VYPSNPQQSVSTAVGCSPEHPTTSGLRLWAGNVVYGVEDTPWPVRAKARIVAALGEGTGCIIAWAEKLWRQRGSLPLITLLLSLLALAVHVLPGAREAMQMERAALGEGQLWRVLTCHWAHFNAEHLLWDVAVFFLLGAICELRNRKALLLALGTSVLAVPAAVLLLLPEMTIYCGLSGLDSALFALLATAVLVEKLRTRSWGWTVAVGLSFAALATKIGYELITGQALFVDNAAAGFIPVPLAHAAGAMAGALAALLVSRRAEPGQSRRALATSSATGAYND
jgi:rhomboid family GlyGly-CTERM serine protease